MSKVGEIIVILQNKAEITSKSVIELVSIDPGTSGEDVLQFVAMLK